MASRNSLNKLVNARKGQEPMEYGKDRQVESKFENIFMWAHLKILFSRL